MPSGNSADGWFVLSDFLRGKLKKDERQFLLDMSAFLVNYRGVSQVVRELRGDGASILNMLSVLEIVAASAFGWGKPYERLYTREFTRGSREAGGIKTVPMQERAMHRAVRALTDAGLLCRFSLRASRSADFFSISPKAAIVRVLPFYEGDADIGYGPAVRHFRTLERLRSSPILDRLDGVICGMSGRSFGSVQEAQEAAEHLFAEDFASDCKNREEATVSNLARKVADAKAETLSRRSRKTAETADAPFFSEGGSINAAAALAFWNRTAADAIHGYVADSTASARARMGQWLKELRAEDLCDADVRQLIADCIRKWPNLRLEDRWLPYTDSKGEARKLPVAGTPEFRNFFALRRSLLPVFEKTCVSGMQADGKPRRRLPDFM